MDHIAIIRKAKLSKRDDLPGDILNGTKTIGFRWYVNKVAPWNKISTGDVVYFKESGHLITAKAIVEKIIPFEIDKTGFGSAAAWLVVKDVSKVIK